MGPGAVPEAVLEEAGADAAGVGLLGALRSRALLSSMMHSLMNLSKVSGVEA